MLYNLRSADLVPLFCGGDLLSLVCLEDFRNHRERICLALIVIRCIRALLVRVKATSDGFDPELEQYFGRTYADSPEIDGRVWIASEEALVEGEFVRVCIDGLVDGDLSGYIVEE